MATKSKRPRGHYWVICKATNGKRRSIRLGKATAKQAQDFADYVTALEAAHAMGRLPDPPTLAWLAGLNATLHRRVANTGLVEQRGGATDKSEHAKGTLAWLCADYPKTLDVKESTLVNVGNVTRNLLKYFAGDRAIASITAGDADKFRIWLRQYGRKKSDEPLAYATVSRRVRLAGQIFEYAKRSGWRTDNPFSHMSDYCETNPAKDAYIPAEWMVRIIDEEPELEYRVMFALARFAGVRPSDVLDATWDAVDWQEWYLLIRSPKTRRSRSGGIRDTPLREETRSHLEALWDRSSEQAEAETYLFPRLRTLSHAALTDRLERRSIRLGIQPWPKPWINLRASAENDWIREGHSIFEVARWMGHSPDVALRHYNRVAKDRTPRSGAQVFREALRLEEEPSKRSASRSACNGDDGDPR